MVIIGKTTKRTKIPSAEPENVKTLYPPFKARIISLSFDDVRKILNIRRIRKILNIEMIEIASNE